MLHKKNFIRKIYQKTNTVFTIEWMDGRITDYKLSDLQKLCACARCLDEVTGKRISDTSLISEDLTAIRVYSIGRYALKIEFSSGCSRGIFPYTWLRQHAFE
ncbi:MAG: DUF971 domain-containing protein [Chlamydiae bacterium]|nr:DUF971 domain-containing protein [Chlamydiota bacterium]